MVSARRLERLTDRLEGDCSIQLSYGDITRSQERLYNKNVVISRLFFIFYYISQIFIWISVLVFKPEISMVIIYSMFPCIKGVVNYEKMETY